MALSSLTAEVLAAGKWLPWIFVSRLLSGVLVKRGTDYRDPF